MTEQFNVYRHGRVHIQRAMCPTCIWRSGSVIDRERVEQMDRDANADLSAIVCHETLATDENAACRGHLDRGCTVLQLAVRMGVVEWVRNVWDVPDLPE